MASPGLPESITAGVTTGHVTDHEKIHDLLNEFDSAAQAQATGDLLVFQDGLIKRLPVGSDGQVLTADSAAAAGVKWATPTGGGGGGSGWSPILDEKGTADPPDDEFDGPTLDSKWTAVSGSPGTVDLFATGTVGVYDLTTRPGTLLIQAKDASVRLRQDYTLPDGKSIVCALDALHNYGSNNHQAGIGVSAGNTSQFDTGWSIAYEQDGTDDYDIQTLSGPSSGGNTWDGSGFIGRIYFRIARVNLTYHFFFSVDGFSWRWLDSRTMDSAASHLWLWVDGAAPTVAPICAFDWFRQGSNDFDPW